jgi:hypothetical protein
MLKMQNKPGKLLKTSEGFGQNITHPEKSMKTEHIPKSLGF